MGQPEPSAAPRTLVRCDAGPTRCAPYGCQMNVHDSERLAGLLEDAGYVALPRRRRADGADVVVFNTCAVRENADNKLYGNLGHLRAGQGAPPGHADRRRRLPGAEGPRRDRPRARPGSTSSSAPTTSARCRCCSSAPGTTTRRRSRSWSPSRSSRRTLPTRRESAYAGWVSISVGCNNTCTFCIVPSLRGKEKDRRPGEILAEVEALVAQGALEVTLLGQNVNTYGVEFGDRRRVRQAAARLRRDRGPRAGPVHQPAPGGVHRRRHRRDGRDPERDAAAAHAAAVRLRPGAARPCAAPTGRSAFLGIIDRVRAAIPDAAITTDIIVGFPGETEEDFQAHAATSSRAARFASAFTFQYSHAPRHPAADAARPAAQGRRAGALRAAGRAAGARSPGQENQRQVGRTRRGARGRGRGAQGRRDPPPLRPRAGQPAGALRACPARRRACRGPGTWSTVEVTYGAPHHLVADAALHGGAFAVRRTARGRRVGLAREPATRRPVGLGLPRVGASPAPAVGCRCPAAADRAFVSCRRGRPPPAPPCRSDRRTCRRSPCPPRHRPASEPRRCTSRPGPGWSRIAFSALAFASSNKPMSLAPVRWSSAAVRPDVGIVPRGARGSATPGRAVHERAAAGHHPVE